MTTVPTPPPLSQPLLDERLIPLAALLLPYAVPLALVALCTGACSAAVYCYMLKRCLCGLGYYACCCCCCGGSRTRPAYGLRQFASPPPRDMSWIEPSAFYQPPPEPAAETGSWPTWTRQ